MSLPIDTDQLVLSLNTRQKLIDYHILQLEPDDYGYEVFTAEVDFSLPYPQYKFTKVPFRQDTLAFVKYLGLRSPQADSLYDNTKAKSDDRNEALTGIFLFLEIERYAQRQEMEGESTQNILPDTQEGNAYMWNLGFAFDFITDMNKLWRKTREDPSIMIEYAREVAFTENVKNLDLLDYMFAILRARKANLWAFEEAAQEFLADLVELSV